jgi:hypothetical protein
MALVKKPRPTFLGKLAPEEILDNGQLFVYWTGLYWSPNSTEAILFPDMTALDDYVQAHPEIKY